MKLYIGGYGQGKLSYVLDQLGKDKSYIVCNGEKENPKQYEDTKDILILNHFHLWIKNLLLEEKDVKKEVEFLLEKFPGCLIISDEIGNGIVPIEPFERRYRDCVGEILISAAKKAERVERILCGMGQILK